MNPTRGASLQSELLDDLQNSLAHGSVSRRVEILRSITDLFIYGADDYTGEQIEVFDDVFACLILKIETSARVTLANRLAPVSSAPPKTIRTLALDDEIEVAEPVLSRSPQLDDAALIETAASKSQQHLMAISRRATLSGAVTDALIEHGDDAVVTSTVENNGAAFTDRGYEMLLSRADDNDALCECVGRRPAIPRPYFLRLIARASASVRDRLSATQNAADIDSAIAKAASEIRWASATAAGAQAMQLVEALYRDGRLDNAQIAAFAAKRKFEEINAALARLANLPIEDVESILASGSEGLVVLAKVADLAWETVVAIAAMQSGASDTIAHDAQLARDNYEALRPATAVQVLQFFKMRRSAIGESMPS